MSEDVASMRKFPATDQPRRGICVLILVTSALHSLNAWAGEFRAYKEPIGVELALEDIDGRPYKLTDYRGQIVLVNFWATWCPPCIEEMPALGRLRQRLADQGFEILAVNMGDQEKSVRDFVRRITVRFPVLLDPDGTAAREWRVFALPTSFLVNAQGLATHELSGTADWDGSTATTLIETMIQRNVDED